MNHRNQDHDGCIHWTCFRMFRGDRCVKDLRHEPGVVTIRGGTLEERVRGCIAMNAKGTGVTHVPGYCYADPVELVAPCGDCRARDAGCQGCGGRGVVSLTVPNDLAVMTP